MSIAAADWLAGATVDPAIFERWPDYRVVLVASDAVDAGVVGPAADALFAEAVAHARRAVDPAAPPPQVAGWHAAYRDFGVKPRVARPSVDALIRRATSDTGLPRIGPLVDLYNAISILELVPIGGEDLDRYEGPPRLHLATGSEPFHTVASGEPVIEHPEPGEPVWVDGGGVTCRRWNWRQTSRTAIHTATARVGFIVDSLDAPDHAGAANAAARLIELFPGAISRSIDRLA